MANTLQMVSGANTFIQVLAQLLGARNQAAQYRGAAAAENYNAAVARQRAEVTRSIFGQREEQFRRSSRLELARQTAAGVESGLGLDADLERQSSVLAELDALNVRYEGELQAHGFESEARLSKFNARNYRRLSKDTIAAGYIGAAGEILGGYGDYTRLGAKT